MAKLLEYNATLTSRIDLEPTLAIFRLELDEPYATSPDKDGPWFVPGQYVTIGMNREVVEDETDDRPVSVRRPMSIASGPADEKGLDFYIRKVGTPESTLPLTHLMWDIKVGDRMYCRANPTGKFTVADTVGEDDARLKVMLAAGTGLAPFVSIARDAIAKDANADLSNLAILHGASYPTSLGYREELLGLQKTNGLRYIGTISRPHEVPDWDGFSGRAEALFGEGNMAKTEEALGLGVGGMRPDNAVVLICGLQGTIGTTIVNLIDRGFVPDNRKLRRILEVPEDVPATVFWEQYDTSPVLDTKDEALMADLRRRLHATFG